MDDMPVNPQNGDSWKRIAKTVGSPMTGRFLGSLTSNVEFDRRFPIWVVEKLVEEAYQVGVRSGGSK